MEVDMIKKNILFISLCVGFVFLFASCGSTPKAEPDSLPAVTPPVEPVVQEEVPAGPSEEPERATVSISDVYEARQRAVDAGAELYLPNELAELDSFFEELKILTESNAADVESLDRGAETLILSYHDLEDIALLLSSKEAEEALAERAAALEAKVRADGIKAAITEQDAYGEAVALFAEGDSSLKSADIEAALLNYKDARETFEAVFERVSKKREQAIEAIRLATLRAQESENFALEADAIELPPEEDELSEEIPQ
jgi:hypothetical protein